LPHHVQKNLCGLIVKVLTSLSQDCGPKHVQMCICVLCMYTYTYTYEFFIYIKNMNDMWPWWRMTCGYDCRMLHDLISWGLKKKIGLDSHPQKNLDHENQIKNISMKFQSGTCDYLTLRSISSFNNSQNNEMKFCENMKTTFWKSS
jgi:hypothetical protein